MLNEVSVNVKTNKARVFVLEDHEETVNCICKELRLDGKIVSVAKNMNQFEHLLKGEVKADACSIDWSINNRYIGAEALKKIKTHEKECGTFVYTAYPDQINTAFSEGADYALVKGFDNYDEYLLEAEKAVQLGLLRKISERLKELGCLITSEVTPDKKEEEEAKIFKKAREIAFEKLLNGDDDTLIYLLKRRGWWKSFDSAHYSNLPFAEKLVYLLSNVQIKSEDITQILQCNKSDVQTILNDKKIPKKLQNKTERLLSILSYILRLSGYEPELMPYFWTVKKLFSGSLSSPPWDVVGLNEYLKCFKKDNNTIEKSLFWIRKN